MDHFLKSEWRLAAEGFLKLAESEPTNLTHLTNAAYAQLKRSMYRRCIKLCEKAVSKDIFCLRAYCLCAEAYVGMGKKSKAKKKLLEGMKTLENVKADTAVDVLLVLQLSQVMVLQQQ